MLIRQAPDILPSEITPKAAYLSRRQIIAAAAGLSTAGIWLADVVMYGALAHGFHLTPSLPALLLLVGAGNLALAVPGTAAGLGSFELLTLASAHGLGLGGGDLAAFVLAVHAVIILPTTVVGLVLAVPFGIRPRGVKPRYRAPA